jgi:hypothetical protein
MSYLYLRHLLKRRGNSGVFPGFNSLNSKKNKKKIVKKKNKNDKKKKKKEDPPSDVESTFEDDPHEVILTFFSILKIAGMGHKRSKNITSRENSIPGK